MLVPKILTVFKQGYDFKQFKTDLIAGFIVGIVALPLAIAFAIASGVTPDKGLITAIVAGFLVSLLGGSRVQIGGPTGAFCIIVYGIIAQYGIDGLITATFLAGIMLVLFGIFKFGGVIKFVPQPVTIGFTSGIAVVIFITQIKELLGLTIEKVPADFFEKIAVYAQNLGTLNWYAVLTSVLTILIIVLWQKYNKKIPGAIVALLIVSALANIFKWPIETIGSFFGEIPSNLPAPQIPHISFNLIRNLFSPALAIALLAGIESLLSAVVADGMIGSKHRSNIELVAQGIANIGSALFGGIPATGAIARTSTNVHNGGRTPVAGIVHALTLLLIVLFFGKFAVKIPLAVLAGILAVVSYKMADIPAFIKTFKAPKSDIIVLLTTFLLTVIIDLVVAIQVGVLLAVFLLVKRLTDTHNIAEITQNIKDSDKDYKIFGIGEIPKEIEIFEIQGPLFFAVISNFIDTIITPKTKKGHANIKILRMRAVQSIDASAINAIRQIFDFCKKNKITLILSGVNPQPKFALQKDGLLNEIGEDKIFQNIEEALQYAKGLL